MFVYKQSNETSTLKNIGKGHTLTFSLPKRPFAEQPLIDNRNPSEMMQTQTYHKWIKGQKDFSKIFRIKFCTLSRYNSIRFAF